MKDVLCILRWAENPKDTVAGFRVLQPGAVSTQPDFERKRVMLRHGAYLFVTRETAPWGAGTITTK